ncbi:MoaD/ThiS family protein [Methanimicrococcus blatticola]|uniref:Sulfur carrier protein ThiS n=1 Tax=Methanimicrococcus blatticola TaxID=91560 RepID=A0A484F430_9EURY|nr:MoaD/ThiS family protein [Methanimicrococcus blatticola]MBZ3935626.1 MoaD/ThiS family protein [Methanimicrococcus blatticola]MCC2509267.1 MoaD/ThiS family protein [Methanimicrococcus blatticola]TDQ69367.1 sulfur carrier protein ThiS [Methanimicrococcus blatticola]
MKISISVFGTHKKITENLIHMEIPEQSSVKGLITEFAFTHLADPDLVIDKEGNLKRHLIIQVNKKRVIPGKAADFILKDGDEVTVYPSVSGG